MNLIDYTEKFFGSLERTRNLQYGVLIRSVFNGKTFAHIDDTACHSEGQALEEAFSLFQRDRNCILGIFTVNMVTGETVQLMDMTATIDYCEKRERAELSDAERNAQAEVEAHNFRNGATL